MNSAIQIKLFSSADPDLYLLGRGGGGGGASEPWELGGGGSSPRRAPPLDPPLLSKVPILQEMNDDAGIFFLKKSDQRFYNK